MHLGEVVFTQNCLCPGPGLAFTPLGWGALALLAVRGLRGVGLFLKWCAPGYPSGDRKVAGCGAYSLVVGRATGAQKVAAGLL